jgi:hypothetical protein
VLYWFESNYNVCIKLRFCLSKSHGDLKHRRLWFSAIQKSVYLHTQQAINIKNVELFCLIISGQSPDLSVALN